MPGLCLTPTSLELRYSNGTEEAQARYSCTKVGTAWCTGSGRLQVHFSHSLPGLCHNCTQLHCTQNCTSLYLICGSTRVPIALTVREASTAPGTVRVQQMQSRQAHSRYALATALPQTAPTAPAAACCSPGAQRVRSRAHALPQNRRPTSHPRVPLTLVYHSAAPAVAVSAPKRRYPQSQVRYGKYTAVPRKAQTGTLGGYRSGTAGYRAV